MKKVLRSAAYILFWIAVWQGVSMLVKKEFILPSPISAFRALLGLLADSGFYTSSLTSLLRVFAGFASGALVGVIFAALIYIFPIAEGFLSPILSVMRATPVASIIIILFVWVNRNYVPSFSSMLIVAPLVCDNVYTGLRNTNADLLETAKIYKLKPLSVVNNIYLPSVLPYFGAAANAGIGIAWKAGIAAEVICNPRFGIGSGLYESKIYLETPQMFAWTAVIIIISVICEKLFRTLFGALGGRRARNAVGK